MGLFCNGGFLFFVLGVAYSFLFSLVGGVVCLLFSTSKKIECKHL